MRIVAAICIFLVGTVSTAQQSHPRATDHGTVGQLLLALRTSEKVWKYETTNINERRECEYLLIKNPSQMNYVLDRIYKESGRLERTRFNATASSESSNVQGAKLTVHSEKGPIRDYLLLYWDNNSHCGVFSNGPHGQGKTTADVCEMYIYDNSVKNGLLPKCEGYFKDYCRNFANHDKPNIVYNSDCQLDQGC